MPIFSKKVNSLIVDLEKSSEEFWNVPREVAQLLYFLVRSSKAKRVLEIGTSNGYSGIWLGQALMENKLELNIDCKLLTVESHLERFEMAGRNFQAAGLAEVIRQIQGHAPEVFAADDDIKAGDFDLMFFDATKKQHVEFLRQGMGLLSEGGLMIVDNVLSHWEVMQHFVSEAEGMTNLLGEVLKIGDGVFIGIKKEA